MNLSWFLIRGSGFAAFGLLTASVVWGLMISSKVFGRAVKAKGLQWLHESLGLAALVATVAHMVALYLDTFVEFTWVEILVPGTSDWDPLAIALGAVGFWVMTFVSLTFYVKKWIGQTRWRRIHYLSFGVFVAAAGHGILAGTDTTNPYAVAIYVAAVATVVLLTVIRIAGAREPSPRAGRPAPTAIGVDP